MNTITNSESEKEKLLQLVSFKINNEEFAVEIANVQEIMRMISITKLPNFPDYVEGIINLRGKVINVINLRNRLNLPYQKADKDTRIIIVEISGKSTGFVVDQVNEVLRVSAGIMEPPPNIVGEVHSKFIEAVGKLDERLLILLNLNTILHLEEIELVAV